MTLKQILLSLLLMYVLFSLSCKKDEDTSPPTVSISAPSENSTYDTFDTLIVKASIQDDREITFVSVEILNADLISVVTPFSTRPNSPTYNLNAPIIIDNIHLTSGKHYIRVTAQDGSNSTLKYLEIYINGIPYTTRGYMSFENVNGQIEVHNYYLGSDSLIYSSPGVINGGVIDSYYQQFGILNSESKSFHAFPLFPFVSPWEISNLHGGVNKCRSQDNSLPIQLCFVNGITSFYTGEASLKRSFNSAANYYPAFSHDHDDNAIIWQVNASPNANRIETFYSTGALHQITNFNGDIVGMEKRDDNFIYLVSNQNSLGIVDVYDLSEGLYTSFPVNEGEFFDSCVDSEGNLYVASSEGVKRFDRYSFQFSNYSTVVGEQIAWNRISNKMLVATSTQFIELDQFGGIAISQPLSGDCVELGVWYSK